ncbi:hypothetical protein GCM10009839_93310 [Catenulispora yoronensis]|uniref:N-acetyltransferase domain-containing protein n=1 Tax=Catenulispora yoronensis TaxID=450799 RepID=A0ABN2VNQ0_9ACTN
MSWLDFVGWAAAAVLVWSLLQASQVRFRAFNLLGCLVLIVFNWALGVWPQVGLNVVLAGINGYFLCRLLATRHDERTYQVVPVRDDDTFLDHVLRVHGDDIRAFNPGFRRETGPDRFAYLVMTGDALVGVVLVRALDADTAQVELDYVTKPYRDFTPGEFVYRSSRLFTDQGFRKVLTPPGEVAPYYDRIGFKRSGESFVLEY